MSYTATRTRPVPFVLGLQPDREIVIVRPEGELDLSTLPELEHAVAGLVDAGFDALRLDLGRLTFIDSSGVTFVLRLALREDVTLTVVPGPPAVQRVFEVAGLAGVVPFER